jgi:hypothetical protein
MLSNCHAKNNIFKSREWQLPEAVHFPDFHRFVTGPRGVAPPDGR